MSQRIRSLEGVTRVTLPIAVQAHSLATRFAPVVAAYAADAPVLVELLLCDQDHTAEWLRSGAVLAAVMCTARRRVRMRRPSVLDAFIQHHHFAPAHGTRLAGSRSHAVGAGHPSA